MTDTTVGALHVKKISSTVMMTGTINPDGSIGPIGGVLEKAQAAFEHSATTFLIPEGQETVYITEEKVSQGMGWISQLLPPLEV